MVTHVSIATALDKGKLDSGVTYVALLEIDVLDTAGNVIEIIRYTHNNEDYNFAGNNYIAMPFEFELSESKNELPELTLTLYDVTQAIQARLQEYEGGVDFPVRVKVVSSVNNTSPEIEETFTILSARSRSSDYGITFTLGAENPLSLRFPTRQQFRNRCLWRYRGNYCKYTGGLPTCDFSFDGPNGCKAHNNTQNFGGFPGIRRNGYSG